MDVESASSMAPMNPECDAAVAELRKQGVTVTFQSPQKNTWYISDISDGGLYTGYILSSGELVELRRAKKLNILDIRELRKELICIVLMSHRIEINPHGKP